MCLYKYIIFILTGILKSHQDNSEVIKISEAYYNMNERGLLNEPFN